MICPTNFEVEEEKKKVVVVVEEEESVVPRATAVLLVNVADHPMKRFVDDVVFDEIRVEMVPVASVVIAVAAAVVDPPHLEPKKRTLRYS